MIVQMRRGIFFTRAYHRKPVTFACFIFHLDTGDPCVGNHAEYKRGEASSALLPGHSISAIHFSLTSKNSSEMISRIESCKFALRSSCSPRSTFISSSLSLSLSLCYLFACSYSHLFPRLFHFKPSKATRVASVKPLKSILL